MRWTLAAALTASLIGPLVLDAASAQQPDTASPFKPVDPPKLDPEVFKPHAEPRGTNTQDLATSGQHQRQQPAGVEIGRYDRFKLNFDAAHTRDISPRTGYDSGEASNLSKSLQQDNSQKAMPDYFGLKLSTPTN